jgi:hypothetical protein
MDSYVPNYQGRWFILLANLRTEWDFTRMETVFGKVDSDPRPEAVLPGGLSVTFFLRMQDDSILSCVSSSDFKGNIPRRGTPIAVNGERKLHLGRTSCFIFTGIEGR